VVYTGKKDSPNSIKRGTAKVVIRGKGSYARKLCGGLNKPPLF